MFRVARDVSFPWIGILLGVLAVAGWVGIARGEGELLSQKRRELEAALRQSLAETSHEDTVFELSLRLAKLYREDFSAGLVGGSAKGDKKGRAALDSAIKLYRGLVFLYPANARRDEALYRLAVALSDRGEPDSGASLLRQLLGEAPQSRFVDVALTQLGDYHFEKNEYAAAERFYDPLIAREAAIAGYALYRKAWCAYHAGRAEESLRLFRASLEREDDRAAKSPVHLTREILADITLPFVDLNRLEEGMEFFRSRGDVARREGWSAMARLYFAKAGYAAAIHLWQALLDESETDPKSFGYEASFLEALIRMERPKEAIERLVARAPIYLAASTWYDANGKRPEVLREARDRFEALTRATALTCHAGAQKTKEEAAYRTAKDLYTLYLQYFADAAEGPQMRFNLAEALYFLKDDEAAADHYLRVSRSASGSERLRRVAIRHALDALDRRMNEDRKARDLTPVSSRSISRIDESPGADVAPTPYSDVEKRFLSVAGEYVKRYPSAADAPDVVYLTAYVHYVHVDFDLARAGFRRLIASAPKHEMTYASGRLTLDTYNRSQDYAALVGESRALLANKRLVDQAFRAEVSDILRRAELKLIHLFEEKSRFLEAAEGYLAYVKAHGAEDPDLCEKSLYNASVNYQKAGELGLAVAAQEKLLGSLRPDGGIDEAALRLAIAKNHERLGNLGKAADALKRFSERFVSHPEAATALRFAGLFHWGNGSLDEAVSAMLAHIARYPASARSVDEDLAQLLALGAPHKEIDVHHRRLADRNLSPLGHLLHSARLVELTREKRSELLSYLHAHASRILEEPGGAAAMARILFRSVMEREVEFREVRLSAGPGGLEARTKKKIEILAELDRQYTSVVSLDESDWSQGAHFRLASLYADMAGEVRHAPVPAELGSEALDVYRSQLEETAVAPFLEKAASHVKACLAESGGDRGRSPWTASCYALASQMDPRRVPRLRTFTLAPIRLGLMPVDPKSSKILPGLIREPLYPYGSSGLFVRRESTVPNRFPDDSKEGDVTAGVSDALPLHPILMSYQRLEKRRRETLEADYKRARAREKGVSFALLNVSRLLSPKEALPDVLSAIRRDPFNEALHLLLGLTHWEQGNLAAARIVWVAMVARGVKHPALFNNLGVAAYLVGNEDEAARYFKEAAASGPCVEALSNLGYLALKYRNGKIAKHRFEQATSLVERDAPSETGLVVAQAIESDSDAGAGFEKLVKRLPEDPFAHLAASFYFLDREGDRKKAADLLSRLASDEEEEAEDGLLLRRARFEVRSLAFGGEL